MSNKSKRRHCPALGREITSQECGADRITAIACAEDCPFNTFAPVNYADFSDLEARFMEKMRLRLLKSLSPERANALLDRLERGGKEVLLTHYQYIRELFFTRDAAGRNFWQAWEEKGWEGLNNDERIVARGHAATRPALLECRRVLSGDTFEAVDLLHPGDGLLVICDHATTSRLRRFHVLITWTYPLPHYWRTSGAALPVDSAGTAEPLEVCQEIARHLGGAADFAELPDWLWRNFTEFHSAYAAVKAARWEQMLRLMNLKLTATSYAVTDFAGLCGRMDDSPEFDETDLSPESAPRGYERCYELLKSGSGAPPSGDATVLGNILFGKKSLEATASTSDAADALKEALARTAGDCVKFQAERIDDVAGQFLEKSQVAWDAALVPPRLLEDPEQFQMQSQRLPVAEGKSAEDAGREVVQNMFATFPDDPLPRLNGLTPRQAAADPAMRPALVHLAKGHITKCDDMRHRRGLDVDFNPVLETLGLHELLFPAPPLPEIPEDELEEEEDDREYSDEVIAPSELLDSPITAQEEIRFMQQPPRLQVLSQQVCENAIHSVPPGIKELDWLERTWPRLWTMLDNEATARLSDRDYSIVIMEVSLAAAVLCPGGEPEGANPNERRFVFHLCREMTAMLEAARPGSVEALEHYSRHSPQPHLSYLLCGQLMGLTLTNQFKFKTEEAMMLLPYLKAAIWEICAPLE